MKKCCIGLMLLANASVYALQPEVAAFRAPAAMPREVVKGFVWVEAEGFSDYGAWRLDTQFVNNMGSAYLLAAGVLSPIGAAHTMVTIPSAGDWTVWVRTKDWLPQYHPGTFRVTLNGKASGKLGASGKEGWCWERAGTWKLDAGVATLALDDLSGAFARCDALLLTKDAKYVPPDDAQRCEAARARFSGLDTRIADGGAYAFVVVGAGPGGLGAAIAAARHGAKVLLVHDRPLLGGNASTELGVPTDGAAISHANAREGGLCEEANLRRVGTKDGTLSAAFSQMAAKLPNLTIRYNARVEAVEKKGDKIAAVIARDTLNGKRTRYAGTLFLDGTGDGWIGYYAGAKLLYGREAKSEYNEYPAPEKRDEMLMSGCLMGYYLGYQYRETDHAVPYVTPKWARVLPKGFIRHTKYPYSQWWVEHSGRINELKEPERARDELVRINLAYWGWLKNEWEHKNTIANYALTEMAHANGRREGYRLEGDYILTGNDCLEGKMFDDRIAYGGWPLDRHDPEGMDNPTGNGYCPIHPNVPIYSIPYRVMYSKNVPNLMMAGRNASVTHVALGSMRVEATIMTVAQAAGTAAAMMLRQGKLPRAFGQDPANIRALQQALLKDDQYIPGLVNEDAADLARKATVTATSQSHERLSPWADPSYYLLADVKHELNMPRATCHVRGAERELAAFACLLSSTADKPVSVTARLYAATDAHRLDAASPCIGQATASVPAGHHDTVMFVLDKPLALTTPYVWVVLDRAPKVFWQVRGRSGSKDGLVRAWKGGKDWSLVHGEAYAFIPSSPQGILLDAKPSYVIDGVSRPIGSCTHAWVSDPNQKLPQAITLDFGKPVNVNEIRVTFDSDLEPLHPAKHPKTLVRAYGVEGQTADGVWQKLADVPENLLRHGVHAFAARALKAVRVTVRATWGDPSARIFEIRVYGPPAAEPPRWLSIFTLPADESQYAHYADDIQALARDSIVDAVAYSCTLVPEGEPAVDKAAVLAARYRKMHARLKGKGVKEGILFQATMGHGWKPDSPTRWQKVVNHRGQERYKHCPLGKPFLDFMAKQAATLGALHPDFFMVDDDTRLITGLGGCFCPLHLAEISRRTGRTFATRQELQAALAKDAALAAAWDNLLRDSIADLLKIIRAQIPAEIPGMFCCCASDTHHAGYLASLLTAPGQTPAVRINNARYMRYRNLCTPFASTLSRTARQIADLPAGTIVLDEADTCPQVRYSLGGQELIHHIAMTTLEGCRGAKIWITRLGNMHEQESGKAYRAQFKAQKGYMEALAKLGFRPEGVRIALPKPDPHRAGVQRSKDDAPVDWSVLLLGQYGVPWKTGAWRKGDVTALLSDEVRGFSDAELRQILSGGVMLDGAAAVELTRRGFDKLIGVAAKPYAGVSISEERFASETLRGGHWAAADLSARDAAAEVLSTWYHRTSALSSDAKPLGAGSILYKNALGGTVYTIGGYLPRTPNLDGAFNYHNETRKRAILAALARLGGGCVPGGVYYPGDAEVLLRVGRGADGARYVVADNLGIDTLNEIALVCATLPADVQRLTNEGTWQAVPFVCDGSTLTLKTNIESFRPAVLRFIERMDAAVGTTYPYGVCAHVTRSEKLQPTIDAMAGAGIGYVRTDFDYPVLHRKDGSWDFSRYDKILAALDAQGMKLLPIIYGCTGKQPVKDEAAYRDYIRRIITHYGRRLPVVEIWNEANLAGFFKSADPVEYANTLKIAYDEIKRIDPGIRVAYTGTAGVPLDWIRKSFAAGATNAFDVMNVHPYSHPRRPEGSMDTQTEALRKLMAEFGIADKPLWFTEIGWPTHTATLFYQNILLSGLALARPTQKTWNIVMADNQVDGRVADQTLAQTLEGILPIGSRVEIVSQVELCRRLAVPDDKLPDAVVYPFDETFPLDTASAVKGYLKRGGTFVDFGGIPCYFGRRGDDSPKGSQHGGALGGFPFGYRAWWTSREKDQHKQYPDDARVYATPAGLKAGVKQEPTGFIARRYLALDHAGKDSCWTPLIAGKNAKGEELVAAAVIRYKGEYNGTAVLCSLYPQRGIAGTNNEENQARYTARGLGIAFAEGVEAYFPYNLRSFEVDPYYSEHHFGLMHANFEPKPAYAAYKAFVRERPAGSRNSAGNWHDAERMFYYPQWTKPNGEKCGMLWQVNDKVEQRLLKFEGGQPEFRSFYGRKMILQRTPEGLWRVPVSTAPIYFSKARLVVQ